MVCFCLQTQTDQSTASYCGSGEWCGTNTLFLEHGSMLGMEGAPCAWLERSSQHIFSLSVAGTPLVLPPLRGRKPRDRLFWCILTLSVESAWSCPEPKAYSQYENDVYKWFFPAMENVVFLQPLIPLFLFSPLSLIPLQKVTQSCFPHAVATDDGVRPPDFLLLWGLSVKANGNHKYHWVKRWGKDIVLTADLQAERLVKCKRVNLSC